MKKNIYTFSLIILALFIITSCEKEDGKTESNNGNVVPGSLGKVSEEKKYNTFVFGGKLWMLENLNVKIEGSVCGLENDCEKNDRLYDWNAAMKACPAGWHLPAMSEFDLLFNAFLDTVNLKTWWGSLNGQNAIYWSSVDAEMDKAYATEFKSQGGAWSITPKSNFALVRCVKGELINDSLWLKQQKEYLCSRPAASVMDVVRKNTPNLRKIYNGMLKKKKKFQGKIKIKFSIDDYSGDVVETAIVSSTTGNDLFDEKIKDAVSLWNFGKLQCRVPSQDRVVESIQHGRTTVTIPFNFQE